MIRIVHPGSWLFTRPGYRGSGVKKHRIRIRNTDSFLVFTVYSRAFCTDYWNFITVPVPVDSCVQYRYHPHWLSFFGKHFCVADLFHLVANHRIEVNFYSNPCLGLDPYDKMRHYLDPPLGKSADFSCFSYLVHFLSFLLSFFYQISFIFSIPFVSFLFYPLRFVFPGIRYPTLFFWWKPSVPCVPTPHSVFGI